MSVALWCIFDNLTVYFFSADIFLFFWFISALWSTRETENTLENRELQMKVTLRELLVYFVFLIDVCICELC